MEMYKAMTAECASKEGATQSDIDEALANELPSRYEGKCMHACIGETTNSVSDNL